MDHPSLIRVRAFHSQLQGIERVARVSTSSGIGKALGLLLAGQGAKVVLAARRAELLEQVAAECRHVGSEALAVPTNVADESQCKALVEKTIAAFGRLDMLINNAGLAVVARLEDYSDLSLFRQTLNVNFFGSICCTYYALPHLIRSQGRIVAVSSLGGKTAIPYNTPYCASKYGLHGFYEALRLELTEHNVSVTLICPWWVATGFHAAQLNREGVPRGESRGRDMYTARTMSAERCAEITLRAAYQRRREVLMGPGLLIPWLKAFAPGLLDWLTIKVFLEPAIRRARAAQAKREQGSSEEPNQP